MRRLLVKFILLFAVVGEASLVGLAVRREAAARTAAGCSIAGIGSTSANLDAASGIVRVAPATCEGFLQQASAVDLVSAIRR